MFKGFHRLLRRKLPFLTSFLPPPLLSSELNDDFFLISKTNYMHISLSLLRWVCSILDTGDKCRKQKGSPPAVQLNSYSSFILSTYLLTGSIKCVKNTLFRIAQLTAETPHTVAGSQKPFGVCSQTLWMSHGDLTLRGCPQPQTTNCWKGTLVVGALCS